MRATFGAGSIQLTPIALPRPGEPFAAAPLYGPLLFGGDRFQRLASFETATSRHVLAGLHPDNGTRWFGVYQPERVVLWDPGTADATLHALQVAVPHKRVLPVSAGRIDINRSAGRPVEIRAVETAVLAGSYVFDIVAIDANGRIAWRWTDVTFRAVGRIDIGAALAAVPQLAGPYLERVAREALGDDTIEIALVHDGSRQSRRAVALQALRLDDKVECRADGRPVRVDGNGSICLSHGETVTLAVTADSPIGCDLEASGADADDRDELLRHCAFEVCRKLGRKPTGSDLRALKRASVTAVADVDLVAVDLPIPSGPFTAAFGRIRNPGPTPLQPQLLPVREDVP
jgi:hypothetical protein